MQKKVHSIDRLMGQRLSQRRSELNLTHDNFASKLGVITDQLAAYEQGKKRMSASTLHKASQILDVEMIYFFEEDENSTISNDNTDQQQTFKITLSPQEEARLLNTLSDIEEPAMREKAFKLFKIAKERLS